jgi:hypothetical protein
VTKSLTAKGAKDAKAAKGIIIRSNPKNAKATPSEDLNTALEC